MAVNVYQQQLRPEDIDNLAHREMVGGLWQEVGELQFEYIKAHGLKPDHRLLDIGCGALRGGLHFIRYLERGHYHGLDINPSLIEAGRRELDAVGGLEDRDPQLLVDSGFAASRFGVRFDFALAVSVFTHLPMNHIVRCLVEVRKVLNPGAQLFASHFEAPAAAHIDSLHHAPGGIVSHYDADPYHQSIVEMEALAKFAGMRVARLGPWRHPRGQHMLAFSVA